MCHLVAKSESNSKLSAIYNLQAPSVTGVVNLQGSNRQSSIG